MGYLIPQELRHILSVAVDLLDSRWAGEKAKQVLDIAVDAESVELIAKEKEEREESDAIWWNVSYTYRVISRGKEYQIYIRVEDHIYHTSYHFISAEEVRA